MSEDNKKSWCGLGGFKPVAHCADYSGAAYIAPITLNDGAWDKIKETMRNAKPSELYSFDADGSIIHKKEPAPIYTEEDVRKLQSERDALAATVEALRKAIIEYDDCDTASQSKRACSDMIALAKATPKQHLRDVRAEAVLDFHHAWSQQSKINSLALFTKIYAERVKAGEK